MDTSMVADVTKAKKDRRSCTGALPVGGNRRRAQPVSLGQGSSTTAGRQAPSHPWQSTGRGESG
eukprot:scaffold32581_cov124-Isochrysis_galbana.AAC.6